MLELLFSGAGAGLRREPASASACTSPHLPQEQERAKQTRAGCASCPAVGDLQKKGLVQVVPAQEHLPLCVRLFSALANTQLQQVSLTGST